MTRPATLNPSPPALETLATDINREHEAARAAMARGVEHARRAGELLAQAKAALPHGAWLPWLAAQCVVSERMAQGYMRIAREWPALEAKAQRVADLPLRQAIALLADPRDETPPTPLSVLEAARRACDVAGFTSETMWALIAAEWFVGLHGVHNRDQHPGSVSTGSYHPQWVVTCALCRQLLDRLIPKYDDEGNRLRKTAPEDLELA